MSTLSIDRRDGVAVLTLCRPAKRNALDDATVLRIEEFFRKPGPDVRAVVLDAEGDHFSAGLDLGELTERSTEEALEHSLMWHRVFDTIEGGRVPVVAALKGAVIGGGLELAAAAHIRVADPSTFYALPEGQRGLFVGGGGSVRVPRLIGAHRMADMMLTGRVLDAIEGQAVGLSHYLTDEGGARAKALELAARIAANAPLTNFAVLQALPRIAEASPAGGLLLESLMSAVAAGSADAQERMRAFLDGRAAKVGAARPVPERPTPAGAVPARAVPERPTPARSSPERAVPARPTPARPTPAEEPTGPVAAASPGTPGHAASDAETTREQAPSAQDTPGKAAR